MERGEFREAVNRADTDVGIAARVRATDAMLRWLERRGGDPTAEDVDSALELARQFEAERKGEPAEAIPLDPTAYSRETAALWTRLLEPWAVEFREAVFQSGNPPFAPGDWSRAVAWIEGELDDLEERGRLHDPDHEEVRRAFQRAQGALVREVGGRVQFNPLSRNLSYYGPDAGEVREGAIRGYPTGLQWRGTVPSVVALSNLTAHFEEISGIKQPELVRHILAGVEPDLPRVRLRGVRRFSELPDGTDVSSARVSVDFLTPDVTWDELRDLHRSLQEMWTALGVVRPRNGPRKTPRLTELDRRLLHVVRDLGGVPEHPPEEWWETVDEEFRRRGYDSRSSDAHRIHWSRLQEKLDAPGVSPEGEVIDHTDLP